MNIDGVKKGFLFYTLTTRLLYHVCSIFVMISVALEKYNMACQTLFTKGAYTLGYPHRDST